MLRMTAPLALRKLKAQMVLKDLPLRDVATKAGVGYTRASELLNGQRVDPKDLERLRQVIKAAPMPTTV